MTKAEGAALAELLSVTEHILEQSKPGPLVLNRWDLQQLRDAHGGVMQMISNHRQSAQERLAQNELWQKIIRNRNHQLKLVDDKGNPLDEPELRDDDDLDPDIYGEEQLELLSEGKLMGQVGLSEHGTQGPLEELNPKNEPEGPVEAPGETGWTQDTKEGLEEANSGQSCSETPIQSDPWAIVPGVPELVELGIVKGVEQGLTRAKVVAAVAKAQGKPKPEIDGHFDHLVRLGKIVVKGNKVSLPQQPETADEPEVSPAADTSVSDTVAARAILRKMDLADKASIIEAVAMELSMSSDHVSHEWDRLVFAGRIRKGPAGVWTVAPQLDEVEAASA